MTEEVIAKLIIFGTIENTYRVLRDFCERLFAVLDNLVSCDMRQWCHVVFPAYKGATPIRTGMLKRYKIIVSGYMPKKGLAI